MADDPQRIRQVLRENGRAISGRGRISDEDRALYEDIVAAGDPAAGGPADADGGQAGDTAGAGAPQQETRPQRPRGGGRAGTRLAATTARGWRRWQGGAKTGSGSGARKKKAKPKHPRIPVTGLVSSGWEWLAKISQPVSLPVSRTLKLQAPIAGIILEDTFRETVIDKVLQPAARAQGRGKAVTALMAPPVIVYWMERAQGLPEPARSHRLDLLANMLEESLLLWEEVAGDKFAEAAERMEQREQDRAEVRRIINDTIFAPSRCGKVAAVLPDGHKVPCVREPGHEPPCAVSEDHAAAQAQAFAGAAA